MVNLYIMKLHVLKKMMWQMWLFFIQLLNFEKKTNIKVALWVKLNDDNINNWIITISRPNIEKNLDYFYPNQNKNVLIILHMVTLNLMYAHRMSKKLSSICYACSCISLVKGNLIHFKYMFYFVFSMDYMYKYMYINVVSPEPPISDYA